MPTEVLWWLVAFLLAMLAWVFFLRPDATVRSVADDAKCVHCGHRTPTRPEFCPRCGAYARYREPGMDERFSPFHNRPGGIIRFGKTTAFFTTATNPRPFLIQNNV